MKNDRKRWYWLLPMWAQSTDGTAIRDALAGLSIDAVTGALSFDANGDAVKNTAYIKQAIDGGFQFYKVQTAA